VITIQLTNKANQAKLIQKLEELGLAKAIEDVGGGRVSFWTGTEYVSPEQTTQQPQSDQPSHPAK
jgi:hypothetical protein